MSASQMLADCDPDEVDRTHAGLPPSQATVVRPPPLERTSPSGTCMSRPLPVAFVGF